jgi:hypothetical protein
LENQEKVYCENCASYAKVEKFHGAGKCLKKNKMVADRESCIEGRQKEGR